MSMQLPFLDMLWTIPAAFSRETDYHRYNSYRGVVGETFENIVGRDFSADGPWRKMGTDVTEFKQPWGKAYFAPVYDFGSKEIVAWSTSTSPDMEQQADLLDRLLERMPEGARPVLHPKTWTASIKTTPLGTGSGTPPGSVPSV